MANETKKFLDEEGLKVLWSKISMEDYPNNETLVAILDAIDQTKADKTTINNLKLTASDDGNGLLTIKLGGKE